MAFPENCGAVIIVLTTVASHLDLRSTIRIRMTEMSTQNNNNNNKNKHIKSGIKGTFAFHRGR